MYDGAARPAPAHRDHLVPSVCHEFVWFRRNLAKPVYGLNRRAGEKFYVESYSAWFDTVNQFRGSGPRDGITFGGRVNGRFSEKFLRMIPQSDVNPESRPALWASRAST